MEDGRPKCEYAVLRWEGSWSNALRRVVFSHCEAWEEIAADQFMPTLSRLQAEGWHIVGVERFTDDNLTFSFQRPLTQMIRQGPAPNRPAIRPQ